MGETWRPKPADKFVRPRRLRPFRLRRVLGIPGLFSIGYGDVGSSIYYALGAIAFVALGATPIALGIAGVLYILNALTYAEGSAMVPEGGGSAAYARLAFNDLAGFAAGWALMLGYVVTVAIAAYSIPPYLSYFWPALADPVAGTLLSMAIVLGLMVTNVLGIGEWSGINIFLVSLDIVVLLTLIVFGILLLFIPDPLLLFRNMFGEGNWPSAGNLIFGIAIAALCFTGVESVAQHAEEARRPEKKMPLTYILMIVTVVILFTGISLVALTAMGPHELGDPVSGWARKPMAGIASALSQAIVPEQLAAGIKSAQAHYFFVRLFGGLKDLLPGLVSIVATTILLMATNTGMLSMSRLTYNLSRHRLLPAGISKIHPRFRTPHLAIIVFCTASFLLLLPGFFSNRLFANLAALYVFGSLLVFAFAHASILRLRATRPDLARPFRLSGNVTLRGCQIPVSALLGLVLTAMIWWIVVVVQPYSWWIGMAWFIAGLFLYYIYRKSQRMPLLHAMPPQRNQKIGG